MWRTYRGFSTKLQLQCRECDYKSEHVYSSPYKEDDPSSSFEINTVMTILVHELGKGHDAIRKIQQVLGVSGMSEKSYRTQQKSIQHACNDLMNDNFQQASKAIRSAYLADEDEVLDITVSFDGSWQKRGFTSKYGVGTAMEVQTGLVIDFCVLSTFCHACKVNEKKYKDDTAALAEWKMSHILCCDKKFDGSSKAMEAGAAVRIWSRSLER